MPSSQQATRNASSLEQPATLSLVRSVSHDLNVTLRSSIANFLLPFVALGIIAGALEWSDPAVFTLNFLAILPLASLLSYSTDELSASVGQTIGGLLNATFGNAVELIVGITALSRGEITVVQSSMVGSVLSGILLILGTCLFVAGCKEPTVTFDVGLIGIMSSLMVVSSASLIIPGVLNATSPLQTPFALNDYLLTLSRVASIVLLIFYLVYLYFQLRSHRHLFAENEAENSNETHELGKWPASIVLLSATIGVTVCSDYLVDSIDGVVTAAHISRAFVGLILVPIVGNAGEFATTVAAAARKDLNLAISVIVGSTLQIALFVTPLMVMVGWMMDQPMTLRFEPFETTVFSLAVLVANYLLQDGQSNYFAGALLIGSYIIIAIAFLIHPDIDQ